MIDVKELRVGNWVNDNGKPRKFIENDFTQDMKDFMPVTLTQEILEKAGFIKLTDLNYERDLIRPKRYEDVVNDKIKIFDFQTGDFSAWNNSYLNTIKHLHQLQNLYFSLTGNDLQINLC